MAFLLECEEWRVLQAIAALLEEGKAYCEPRALTVPGWSQDLQQLFWVELRGILAYRERDPYLPMALFHNCQVKLSNVCVLLSRLVNCRRVTVHAEGEAETCEYKGSAYPLLQGLVSFLQTSTGTLNLAGGPDSVLLELPRGISQIEQYLYTVMECNRLIKGLFQAPTVQHGASGQPIFTVKGPMWSDTRHRDKAITVFRSLFERLRCGIQHEILLKVPDNSLPRHVQQELYLSCAQPGEWQAAYCDLSEYNYDINKINNLCHHVERDRLAGHVLQLYVRSDELMGRWTGGHTLDLKACSKRSLDDLVKSGAFQTDYPGSIFSPVGSPPLPSMYTLQDRRQLALRLGYCLLDFYDSNMNSNTIYIFFPPNKSVQKALTCLSFSSNLPVSAESRVFKTGNAVLLSFAKLLLEIDYGRCIQFDVSSNPDQSLPGWVQLNERVDNTGRRDPYFEAVKGCFRVHKQISSGLRRDNFDAFEEDLTVQYCSGGAEKAT